MLCDLPCPYLGMHQTLEVFACWQRDESCSLSPAAQVGCSSSTACAAFRPDLAEPQQLPRTTSPARHPGVTHPLNATTVPRTGDKVRHQGWGRACPLSQLVQAHTERGSVFSKNQTPPSTRKTRWRANYDKHCWSGNWTCELSLHFKGIYFRCILLTWDIKSSTLS